MLSDDKTHEQLNKNSTLKYKGQLFDILKRLKSEDKITESQ